MLTRFIALFILIAAFSCQSLFAQIQTEDLLLMKNGDRVRGEIVEQVLGEYVKVKVLDGTVITFPENEIESIKKAARYTPSYIRVKPLRKIETTYKTKGLYSLLSYGFGTGRDAWNSPTVSISLNYALGYRFNRFVNVGVGGGIEPYYLGIIIPLYLDLRGDVFQRKWTPHYFVNGGYSITGHIASGWWGQQIDSLRPGYYLHVGGGYKLNTTGAAEWIFSLGLKQQQVYYESTRMIWIGNGEQVPINERANRIFNRIVVGVSLGI